MSGSVTNRFKERMARLAAERDKVFQKLTLADAAIALGLPVFPARLVDGDKRPCTRHGHLDASADPVTIRAMFEAAPFADLIGMPTGRASGVVAVDVDIKDGAQGKAWLDAHSAKLPQTRTHHTRSGGLHLIFNLPDVELRNSQSRIAPGIDVRGEGGWIVMPPSAGYSVADGCEPERMPDWLLQAALPPPPAPSSATAPRTSTASGSALGLAALEKRCNDIRTAPDGTKHSTLNEAAYSIGGLVGSGELVEHEAFAALSAALDDIRSKCKNFRAAQRTLRVAFADGKAKPHEIAPLNEPTEEWRETTRPFMENIRAKSAKAASKPLPVAPELMDVPGAIGMFVAHCERTAISPQPFLALAAGISLVGALAGRKYRTATDLRTNLYAAGVADSGAGKDHARKRLKACLAASNLTKYLGGEQIASGQAMLTALDRHPCSLFQIDEFGDFLADVLSTKASAHRREIASNLKTLYSSAATFMGGKEYADSKTKPKVDIQQPHACLYATTTPGQLWAAIAGRSLHDGLMARVLLFVSPCSYPDEAESTHEDVPADLIEALKAIDAGAANPATGEVGNLGQLMIASTAPIAFTAANSPGAEAAYRELRREQIKRQRENEGTYITAIVGRLAENAMKLALVRAVSRNPAWPEIGVDDVAWGRALAMHCIDTLLREAENNVAESEYEAKLKRVLACIRKHGPISSREMIKKSASLSQRERQDILSTLLDSGQITRTEIAPGPKGGRPTIRYSINLFTGETETS
jgi:hypothetical protein